MERSLVMQAASLKWNARAETTPRVLLRWSHYPRVCGPWFDSYPPRRAGSNSIAAFFKVWRITCRVTTVGTAPTTDLSAVQGSYPLCADSYRHLRACGPRMPPLPHGWRIELFHSSRRTPLCVFLITSHTCDDADVLRLSPPFGLRNAAHRLPFTCRLLNGVSRQRPCCTRPPPLALRHHPCRQGSDFSGTTLGFMDRSLVGREAGTTRCSPAADVPRFRASKPPFVPRRTAFPIRPRPSGP